MLTIRFDGLIDMVVSFPLVSLNIDDAITALNRNAEASSTGCCAWHRGALECGGLDCSNRPPSGSAKDYGPYLLSYGFNELSPANYSPRRGDVKVIQNHIGGSIHGHITMFNGTDWVSDFVEDGDWPGQGYRKHKPPFAIFRFKGL